MIDISKIKKGSVLKFKDGWQYEVLQVRPTGLLVAEMPTSEKEFVMNELRYFRTDFLNEASRRGNILHDNESNHEA